MDLVSLFLRLATTYPNDKLLDIDNQDDYLRIKTTHFEATLTVKAAEELAEKFYELKIPRSSLYVGIVRYWLSQRSPVDVTDTPFKRWLRFPWPAVVANEGEGLQEILMNDRIVDHDFFWRCAENYKGTTFNNAHDIQQRLSREGRSTEECWNALVQRRIDEGWSYSPKISYMDKQAPWVVEFDKLDPDTQKNMIEEDAIIDGFGIELRSEEAVKEEWSKAWTPEV